MNVAAVNKRKGIMVFVLTILMPTFMQAMIMDSRYFPWLEQLYTASDHRHSRIIIDPFFIVGGTAYRREIRATPEETIISIPELYGELQLTEVAKSLIAAGRPNPMPEDWRWLSDCKALMPSNMQGQGLDIQGFWSLSSCFGIGGSTLLMRLESMVNILPTEDTIKKLYLETPGNSVEFYQMIDRFYRELGIKNTISNEIGAGDTVLYGAFYNVREYQYKMRKMDLSFWIGMIIPTGVRSTPNNLASIPFGGNGAWGLFVAPTFEFELKDDLKFGGQLRVTQRFSHCETMRLPLGDEQPLFGPTVGPVSIRPGTSITGSAYIVFEDVRAGFGLEGKYTGTYHVEDSYASNMLVNGITPTFKEFKNRSSFVTEFATIRLFYDVAYGKHWNCQPLLYASWDIPFNHIGGKAFAKTNRIQIGCTINF